MNKLVLASAFIVLSFIQILCGQTFSITHNVPINAIPVCNDTATFTITVLTQNPMGSTSDTLKLDLGPGAHYIPGTATVISTLNNATMVPPTITILSENSVNDNFPILAISDLAFADQFTIEYKVVLDCSVIGQAVLLNKIIATMVGSIGSKSESSDQYNASYGVINILPNGPGANQSPNLTFANAVVGQTYMRTIRLRNGGLGYVNSFMFYDTTQIGLSVTPISGGTILSTTTVGNAVIRVYEINNFTGIGNGNDRFETNEIYEVVQQVQVTACTLLLSRFGANFGCFGQISCGNTTGTTRLGGASLNPAVQPNIVTSVRQEPIMCPDDSRTGYIVLKNTGNDAAMNVKLNIYKAVGTTLSTDARFGYLDTATVHYTIYHSGVPTVVDPVITNHIVNSSPGDGCGYLKTREFSITIPLVPAGDSVVVAVDFVGCCNEPCTRNRYIRDGFAFTGMYVNGCGASPRNLVATSVLPRNHLLNESIIEAPTDVNDGDVFDFTIDITRYSFSVPFPIYQYYYDITLPPGVMPPANLSDIQVLQASGLPYTVQPPKLCCKI